ncbi:hypothetical protein, partial [Alistipes ihumii]|uniref:hypothetical protein n=1 Tax=Alistipes ihumii TaxID=1470347 RepID=UPI00265CB372
FHSYSVSISRTRKNQPKVVKNSKFLVIVLFFSCLQSETVIFCRMRRAFAVRGGGLIPVCQ